jgi:nucleoside triphosphate diphosphatase
MEASSDIRRLLDIMAALREPETGCLWDVAQTHRTLAPYALEEACEVVDAIERDDLEHLPDELGDLLLQVVFHARVAEEAGRFAFGDVVQAITAKMIRRHPHVFSSASRPASGGEAAWRAIKAEERRARLADRGAAGVLADIPLSLAGLTRAVKLQTRASSVGFDWGDARLVLAKIREEIDEVEGALAEPDDAGRPARIEDEIGDLLFALANLARHAGVDPESAVRSTNRKFERRFAFIEDRLAARNTGSEQASLDEMDALWDEAKAAGL